MTEKVFSGGFTDLTERTLNSLQVVGLAGRAPVLRWNVKCTLCGSRYAETHTFLSSGGAQCRNQACRKRRMEAEYQQRRRPEPEPSYRFNPADLTVKGKVPL